MIKTQSYNDFSEISSSNKNNKNFMMEQFRQFHASGGDLTLMIKTDAYSYDGIKLITLKDFLYKYLKEDSENILQELMKEGILPGVSDFIWDEVTGSIKDSAEFGLRWMSDKSEGGNFNSHREMILASLEKLFKQLPKDISKIKELHQHDYKGEIEISRHKHPLFKIAEEIAQVEVFDLLFKLKPECKLLWEKTGKYEEPAFVETVKAYYNRVDNPELAITFYMHGIGHDFWNKQENHSKMHELIKHAAHLEKIDFLQEVLTKFDLANLEKGKSAYDLSLSSAHSAKVVEILLNSGAVIEQKYKCNGSEYETNVLFSEYLKSVEAFEKILEMRPQYVNLIKSSPDDFYESIICKKDLSFTKLLVEKYQFPIENYDILSVLYSKQRHSDFHEFGGYKWAAQNGGDFRECDKFCASIVGSREEGLKHLRSLNKEGLLVSKSPDIIFGIFNSSPTKNFVNYYDKLTHIELEKYTKKGFPAWWGATNEEHFSFMFNRIENINQTSQDGMPLVYYLARKEVLERKQISPISVLQKQMKLLEKKKLSQEINLTYKDKEGNNILHWLLTTQKYGKESLDIDILNLFEKHGNKSIIELLKETNNKGITPLENLLNMPEEKKHYWKNPPVIKYIFSLVLEHMDLTTKLSDEQILGEKFISFFNDSKLATEIRAKMLDQQLNHKNETKNSKMKI